MDVLTGFFGSIYDLFQIEITVYGFTFSFWDVFFMFSLIVSVIFGFLGRVLNED